MNEEIKDYTTEVQNKAVENHDNYIPVKKTKCTKKNIAVSIIFLSIVITGITLFSVYFDTIKDYADEYAEFMKGYPELAVLLFMIAYSTSTPFCIPSTFFILIGSFVFGRAFGLLYGFIIFTFVDYICEMIGVVLAFLNGRYLFRKCVQNCIHSRPKLLAISEALTHNAKKLVFLLRASNLTPYDALNYTCSVTDMKLCDYILGNTAIIICDAPYIYVCVSITDLSNVSNSMEGLGDWYYVLLSIGIAITIGVVIAVIFYSRREFRKTLLEIEKKKTIENDSQFQERRQSINEVGFPSPLNENA